MSEPLFSIITPCSPFRYEKTLARAIASVDAQTCADWEHIMVLNSDAFGLVVPYFPPDPRRTWNIAPPNPGWPDIGAWNFRHGTQLARGRYVAYLCDDDQHLPHHLARHLEILETGAEFTVSRTSFYLQGNWLHDTGNDSFVLGQLDSNGVVNRRELHAVGNWRNTGKWDADWDMVNQWREAGHTGVFINEVTGIHHDGHLARLKGLPA